ncbi:hypothetical protein GLOIN_2v1662517 [Rhizophagus irregularis DAOM 181602=DAOM 197198]|uniref:Uncharacterized protein n=1 Tax=Rhizophagus irregularis (strain DAOM 181602 / DAOM 197198 / MUCL 43194) TaxID=747089 RepID=A0A2P4PKI6_RHIID|nr:hypothetical protein GLOIN_2v1662517 [Rhizophagus irregularis DAOM 181602=DAOM 197198]POG65878.1 hypothetical protein GLOIN_2v1662517 [Rhizophagus irregularis DAOM 181602=DAOM 197198]GET64494.1 hypothetical protein GLOIN_2v1662517 [Rhizophagus irregularis DAOM 181602=DAOM 197198]|eukprot:XP_025172744.1 hypothetical protein GLOIN_2v1662517 [Rhizophagus irregularis DAOM 181602=DAOM 197198]
MTYFFNYFLLIVLYLFLIFTFLYFFRFIFLSFILFSLYLFHSFYIIFYLFTKKIFTFIKSFHIFPFFSPLHPLNRA